MEPLLAIAENPSLGILIFALGGLAGAVFYLPFSKVKNWAWESYWLVYAVVGLLIVPWALAFATSPNFLSVLRATPTKELAYCYLCGAAWGLGGLTWGLMIRYLGVGLGLAIGAGLCAAAGTLIPPAIKGEFSKLLEPGAGITSLVGVAIALAGIALVGMAGMSKENEVSEEEKKKAVAEFNFKLGMIVAIFSGLMSSAMSFGLQGGQKIEELALSTAPETPATWKGMPVLVVVLLGGFTVNFIWCVLLNLKNKTGGDYMKPSAPLVGNIIFAGVAGIIWCSQFVSFKLGEPAMGKTSYVGWQVLMACQILFATLLGIWMGEWKGTTSKTRSLLASGLVLLVISSVIAGYSGRLAQSESADEPAGEPQAAAVVNDVGFAARPI